MTVSELLTKFGVQDIRAWDSEYSTVPKGDRIRPLCCGVMSLVTGEYQFAWADKNEPKPSLLDFQDDNVLWVTYAAPAEWGYAINAGFATWDSLPSNIIDLYAEDRLEINGLENMFKQKLKAKLIYALHRHGITDPYGEQKEPLQKLIGNCPDFTLLTPKEREDIRIYQRQDVDMHAALFLDMAPKMNVEQALARGDYSRVTACYEWHGQPVDVEMVNRLTKMRPVMRNMIIEEMEETHHYGVFVRNQKGEWQMSNEGLRDLVFKHGLQDLWPVTATGKYSIANPKRGSEDEKVLKRMANYDATLKPLEMGIRLADSFKSFGLPVGSDGRNRPGNLPFEQKTMRSSPKKGSIHAMPSAFRHLYKPEKDMSLAIGDLSSCEFVVGGVVTGDAAMIKMADDVRLGHADNVYVEIMKAAKVAPPDATKASMREAYKPWKIGSLAVQYGAQPERLQIQLDCPMSLAQRIYATHHETFFTYWRRIKAMVANGETRGYMETLGGWRLDTRNQKHNSLANFPIQANAQEIMHLGAQYMVDRGLPVVLTVHDAAMIYGPTSEIDDMVAAATECWKDAGMAVIGYPIGSDYYVCRWPETFDDGEGGEGWKIMMDYLDRAEKAVLLSEVTV